MKKIMCSLLIVAAMSMTATSVAAEKAQSQVMRLSEVSYASNDWDDILDDFDDYVDDYIALMKKYKAGDMTAMVKAASMLETTNSLSKKLETAQGDLSQDQLSRYLEIVKKLSQATLNIYAN